MIDLFQDLFLEESRIVSIMETESDFPYRDYEEEEEAEVRPPLPTHKERLYGDVEEDEMDPEMRLAMQVSRISAEADAEEEALRAVIEASLVSAEEDERRQAKARVDVVRKRVMALIQRAHPVIERKIACLPELRAERKLSLELLSRYRESTEVTHISVTEEDFNQLYVILLEVQKRYIFTEDEHNELLAHFMP